MLISCCMSVYLASVLVLCIICSIFGGSVEGVLRLRRPIVAHVCCFTVPCVKGAQSMQVA